MGWLCLSCGEVAPPGGQLEQSGPHRFLITSFCALIQGLERRVHDCSVKIRKNRASGSQLRLCFYCS